MYSMSDERTPTPTEKKLAYVRERRLDPEYRKKEHRRATERRKERRDSDPEYRAAWAAQRKLQPAYQRQMERRRLNRHIVNAAKDRACADCGVRYPPFVMDLDHRDPTTKVGNIAVMTQWATEDQIRAEIAKCDVVCANCHRIRTYG